jgi:hypothetical protein
MSQETFSGQGHTEEEAEASHTPLTKALGVSDPEKFYRDFEVTQSGFAAPETVRRAVILRARGHAIPVRWDTEWGVPMDPLDGFIHALRRAMCDAITASQDPEIHAAGDLITDQIKAMGEKLRAYREQAVPAQLEQVADPAPRELMLALACGVHATVHALLAKTPGDPDLTKALGQLERTIKESKQ